MYRMVARRTGTIFAPWEEKLDLPWEARLSTQGEPSMGLSAERAKAPPQEKLSK